MAAVVTTLSPSNPKVVAVPAGSVGIVIPLRPATARQLFVAHTDVMAAVDGPMFDYCEGEPHDYARYQCGLQLYMLRDRLAGVNVPGSSAKASQGITISIKDGVARGSRGRSPDPNAFVAFQLFPGLVEDGRVSVGDKPPENPDGQNNHRIAVGILRDGRVGFAYSYKPLYEFAQQLVAAGFTWAGYTDGGGSASLVTKNADGSLRGTDPDDPDGRRVVSFIVSRKLSVRARATGVRMKITDFVTRPSKARTATLAVGGVVLGGYTIVGIAATVAAKRRQTS